MKLQLSGFLLSALLLSGCISVKYQGETLPETAAVTVVRQEEASKQPAYRVIGKATADGDYHKYSRADLLNRLRTEAKKHGATLLILQGEKIIPGKTETGRPLFDTNFEFDSYDNRWNQMTSDKGIQLKKKPAYTQAIVNFRREITAEFAVFSSSPDKKPVPAVKAPEAKKAAPAVKAPEKKEKTGKETPQKTK